MTRRTAVSLLLAVCLLPVLLLAPVRASAGGASVDSAGAPGPGWYLADVSRARTQKLILVSPTGETSTIYRRKVTSLWGGFLLLDWSADGRTALLSTSGRHGTRLVRVDVTTGAVLELPVPRLDAALLDTDGSGVIARTWKRERSNTRVLDRIAWTGTSTRLLGSTSGAMVLGRNGTVVAGDGDHDRVQLLLSTTSGAVLDRFRPGGFCTPVRWWDSSRLLETCDSDLHLVDPATGSTERLTHGHRHAAGDYGHLDAREAAGRLYVQVAGACGTTFVARETRHSGLRHLQVPGAVGNVVMVDVVGTDLVIEHATSCDGDRPRSVLARFDPVHHEETPLVELGGQESFGRILAFGEIRASQS